MCLNDFLDDRKSEPGPFFVFSAGEIALIETLPHFCETFFRNPDSGVFDGDEHFSIAFGRLEYDGRVRITEFDRVVQQVV